MGKWIRRIFVTVTLVVLSAVVLLGYMLLSGEVEPTAFHPPPAPPLEGPYAPNNRLASAEKLALGMVRGPEDLAVDREGRINAGLESGAIVRLKPDGTPEEWARIDGRPLGLKFDREGNLIVCNGYGNLISVSPDGRSKILTTAAPDGPFSFVDDLDIASDGTIYFTDASDKYTYGQDRLDLLETQPRGRLLSYNPSTRTTKTLLKHLYFANGVALAHDESFVLVNETWAYRVTKYWLKGPMAGRSQPFIENLPGFPDNINSNGKGDYWIALFTTRNADMDRMHPQVLMKKLVSNLPERFIPQPAPYGFVVRVNSQGKPVETLQDPTGATLREVTSALEHNGSLYLGSLHADRIGRVRLR